MGDEQNTENVVVNEEDQLTTARADEEARLAEIEKEEAEKNSVANADAEKEKEAQEANQAESNASAEKANTTVSETKDKVTKKIAKSELSKVQDVDGMLASALRVLASKTLNQAEFADFVDSFPKLFPEE